jgi:hypothetical protein
MPDEPQTISPEKLATLTGFTIPELAAFSRRGFFTKTKSGGYPMLEAVTGCFKAYQELRKEAGTLPTYESMPQCTGATGIPTSVLKKAKRSGCAAFKTGSRIALGPLIKWLFDGGGDSTDWKDHYNKFHALREEVAHKRESGVTILFSAVIQFLGDLIHSFFFGELDRLAQTLPAVLQGRSALEISLTLKEQFDKTKTGLKDRLETMEKGQG